MVPASRHNVASQAAEDAILAAQFENTQRIIALFLLLFKQR